MEEPHRWKTWIKTVPPKPRVVRWVPRIYRFECNNGVCLAEVDDDDVEGLLRKKMGCCGRRNRVFFRATAEEIELWESPTRRRQPRRR